MLRTVRLFVGGVCALCCLVGCEMLSVHPDVSWVPPREAMPIDGYWWEYAHISSGERLRMIRIEKGRAYVVRDVEGGSLSNRVIATGITRTGPGHYTWNRKMVDGVPAAGAATLRLASQRHKSATTGKDCGVGFVLRWTAGLGRHPTSSEKPTLLHPVSATYSIFEVKKMKPWQLYRLDNPAAFAQEMFDMPDATCDDLASVAFLLNDQARLKKLASTASDVSVRIAAIRGITDDSFLLDLALSAAEPSIRKAAIVHLSDTSLFVKIALAEKDLEIRKFVLGKMHDPIQLAVVANEAKDEAIRIATKVRLGKTTWADAIRDAERDDAKIGSVIGAVALSDENPGLFASQIVTLCHRYIRRGDLARIPELKELLNKFGDKSLAEDYMNCGQADMEEAGKCWCSAHGFSVRQGYGSNRVRWGENSK